jgi:AraC-like DNA-binding protein
MKPVLENISNYLQDSSFYAYSYTTTSFDFKWHFHPEYEITFIVKGNGHRLIGNSHQEFSDNDFVLIGPNIPHTWVGKTKGKKVFEAIVIQFTSELVEKILGFKESKQMNALFESSNYGIAFNEDQPNEIKNILYDIINEKGIDKVLKLISLLNKLTHSKSSTISTTLYKYQINKKIETRINKVCLYLENNFSKKITLKEIADLVYMSESNFCKFFKKSTGNTFSDYLNELRINEVCKLLIHSDETIKNIAYNCGFESLSYFNRVFAIKKSTTPSKYKTHHSNKYLKQKTPFR